jgi:hypothetical protein
MRRQISRQVLGSIFFICAAQAEPGDVPVQEKIIITPDPASLLPAADRPWMPQDYESAYLVLSHLPPDKLPDTPTAVFARMVDAGNLSVARDINDPMPQRLLQTQRFLLATAKITGCYLADVKTNPAHREDVAGFEGLFLHELGLLMAQLREIQSIPTPSMESRAMLDPSVEKIKSGLDKIIGDMVLSLSGPQSRSAGARSQVALALREEYPNLAAYLSPQTRTNTQNFLAGLHQ